MTALLRTLLLLALLASPMRAEMERSFWLHASLGLFTQRNYFGPDFPATPMPAKEQVENAARVLCSYGANRLYLVYHRELPIDDARRLFAWWRAACPREVEIVPALVLRMYAREQMPVFTETDLEKLAQFFHDEINAGHLAIYDIASKREVSAQLAVIALTFPRGLIRLGLQPDEALAPPFVAGVADTWSALCHGTRNAEDWQQPGFGAETLRKWVLARNDPPQPIAWNLVTVAWDYSTTQRGGFPGYDDAEKNMALPAGRNRLAAQLIRDIAAPAALRGFSSDLYILHENSRTAAHDGRANSFYECLKRGEDYRGFYSAPLREIAAIYAELAGK